MLSHAIWIMLCSVHYIHSGNEHEVKLLSAGQDNILKGVRVFKHRRTKCTIHSHHSAILPFGQGRSHDLGLKICQLQKDKQHWHTAVDPNIAALAQVTKRAAETATLISVASGLKAQNLPALEDLPLSKTYRKTRVILPTVKRLQ